jgi:transcriptional regulator with XRE-family HTH domain
MKIDKDKVRELREARGWSQEQLAEFARVHARTVQRLEKQGAGSLETIKAVAATLEADIAGLAPTLPPSATASGVSLLGTYGPLLAALTDALKETHHWRQHFHDLFMFRSFFMRRPDPPLYADVEKHADIAATVSLQLHQDVSEGIRQLKRLDYEVQGFGGHIRSLASIGYHISPEVQREGTVLGNELCGHIEFYLGRARKELVARVYPTTAA